MLAKAPTRTTADQFVLAITRSAGELHSSADTEACRALATAVLDSLHMNGPIDRRTLQPLGELSQPDRWTFDEKSRDMAPAFYKMVRGLEALVLQQVVTDWRFSSQKIYPDAPFACISGGFNWVIPATDENGTKIAVAIPKFQASDDQIEHNYKTRQIAARALRLSDEFELPFVFQTINEPMPACVMLRASGDNCWNIVFARDGQPLESSFRGLSSEDIFRFIGRAGYVISGHAGVGFGPLANQATDLVGVYPSLKDYVESRVQVVERIFLDSSRDLLQGSGIPQECLRAMINRVREHALDDQAPRLIHGDLSPWNLLYHDASGAYSVLDWDDARLSTKEEQFGIALMGMRGHLRTPWVHALKQGWLGEAAGNPSYNRFVQDSAAYGMCLAFLYYRALYAQNGFIQKATQNIDQGKLLAELFVNPGTGLGPVAKVEELS